MQVLIYCKFTLHVSGVHGAHHQEYKKLLTADSGTGHSNGATTSSNVATLEEGCCTVTMTCTRGCSYSFLYS